MKKLRETEAQIQMAVVERAQYHPILRDVLISIPNEHQCSPTRGNKLNKMGRKKGACDLFTAYAAGGYHGFFQELKSENGKVSEYQEKFIMDVRRQGYCAGVAYSVDEAWQQQMNYLSLNTKTSCKYCLSDKIWIKDYQYNSKVRYECKSCNKTFTP